MADQACGESVFSAEAVPLPCEGLDLTSLKITPDEGFILSRLDGINTIDAICSSSGLGREKTMAILGSLHQKGLLMVKEPEVQKVVQEEEKSGSAGLAQEKAAPVAIYDVLSLKKMMRKELPKSDELIPLVESVFVNLENLSYYDLLGLSRKSSPKEIKKAYLRRTKVFHPDRFYRRADREFKGKLQEIFKQINKGYKLLTDQEAREKYDASLGAEEDWEAEAAAATAAEAVDTARRTRAVKGEASPWKRIAVPKRKPVEERTRAPRTKKEPKQPSGPKLKLGLKDGKKVASPLLRQVEKKVTQQKGMMTDAQRQAEKFFKGALIEKDKGNFNSARINLKLAVQYDPANAKYKEALEGLDQEEEKERAELEYKSGRDAQKEGDLASALTHYKRALGQGYEDPDLYHKMGELTMELDRNFAKARTMILKAIDMKAGVADYHMTLARAYKGLGQKAAAMMQLQKVLDIEPKNKIAQKELKALKKT